MRFYYIFYLILFTLSILPLYAEDAPPLKIEPRFFVGLKGGAETQSYRLTIPTRIDSFISYDLPFGPSVGLAGHYLFWIRDPHAVGVDASLSLTRYTFTTETSQNIVSGTSKVAASYPGEINFFYRYRIPYFTDQLPKFYAVPKVGWLGSGFTSQDETSTTTLEPYFYYVNYFSTGGTITPIGFDLELPVSFHQIKFGVRGAWKIVIHPFLTEEKYDHNSDEILDPITGDSPKGNWLNHDFSGNLFCRFKEKYEVSLHAHRYSQGFEFSGNGKRLGETISNASISESFGSGYIQIGYYF